MKKSNFTPWGAALTALLISFQSSHTYAAETCVAAPTCSELGYTLTSTSDCVGAVLKCPFDKTKYFCTKKTDVTAQLMPDYSKAVNKSCGTSYTAASDGYIIGSEAFWDNWSNCKQLSGYYIQINGKNVRLSERVHGNYINSWMYMVKKGYTYKVACATCDTSSGWAEYKYQFIPLS